MVPFPPLSNNEDGDNSLDEFGSLKRRPLRHTDVYLGVRKNLEEPFKHDDDGIYSKETNPKFHCGSRKQQRCSKQDNIDDFWPDRDELHEITRTHLDDSERVDSASRAGMDMVSLAKTTLKPWLVFHGSTLNKDDVQYKINQGKAQVQRIAEDARTNLSRFKTERFKRIFDIIIPSTMYLAMFWNFIYCGCIITKTKSFPLFLKDGGKTLPYAQAFLYFGITYAMAGAARFGLDAVRPAIQEIHRHTWFWFPRVGFPLLTMQFLQKYNCHDDLQHFVLTLAGMSFVTGLGKQSRGGDYLGNVGLTLSGLILLGLTWHQRALDAVAGTMLFLISEFHVQQNRGQLLGQSGYFWRSLIISAASLLLIISITDKGANTFTWGIHSKSAHEFFTWAFNSM